MVRKYNCPKIKCPKIKYPKILEINVNYVLFLLKSTLNATLKCVEILKFIHAMRRLYLCSFALNSVFCCRCVADTCAMPIDKGECLIVKTHGVVSYTDKNGKLQKREGAVYLHFLEECLKSYIADFKYSDLQVLEDTEKMLESDEKSFLRSLAIPV